MFSEEFKFRGILLLKGAVKEKLHLSCLFTATLCPDCLCYCGDPTGFHGLRYYHLK